MRYVKRIGILLSAIILLMTAMVVNSAAQRVRYVSSGSYRPVIVRSYVYRDPFWYSRYYDPFYDPYFYDPYLRAQREKYYREHAVKSASRNLAKNREKYGADGVITAKEQKKLMDNQQAYTKAVRKLREYRNDY